MKVKTKEAERYERIAAEEKAAQERQAHHEHIQDLYGRFKTLHKLVKETKNIPSSFKEDLKELGQKLTHDHTFMETLKLRDDKEAKLIQRIAQGKEIEEQERIRSMDRERGGYSL